jgi:hypothetical protein
MQGQLASLSAVLLALSGSGLAAQSPPASPGECYEIINPLRGGTGLILLNRCNGSTWMLTRDPLLDADKRPNRSSTFTWHPLQTAKEPPVLFEIAPAPPPPTPKPFAPNPNDQHS